ncbi:MAG: M42 family metallopeptidase [Aggregatilineales bacterium]
MILQRLSEAIGVSGEENAVREIVLEAINDVAEDIRIDPLGSVTCRLPAVAANEPPLRVLLAAHMDEIGFMVTGFDGDGLIRFAPVGTVDERILPGKRVVIGANAVPGVIAWTPIHLNKEQSVTKLNSLRIDIGASSKEDAQAKVKRGDRIAFSSRYLELEGGMLRGKAFDDRAGCALLIDVLRAGPYPVEVLAAFTVQEEIGLRGARVVAQALRPDAAFVLEATTAHDVPNPTAEADDIIEENPACRVGAGPVLTILDRSIIVNPRLLAFLRETAEAASIPYQFKTAPGGATDAGAIHSAGYGIPTAVVSLPCRYIHSPSAHLHRDDYEHTLQLVKQALGRLTRAAFEFSE